MKLPPDAGFGQDSAPWTRASSAHYLFTDDGQRTLMLAHLRYGDTFVTVDGAWLFAERNLYVDWIETQPSRPD